MHFTATQRFHAAPADVADAFSDPGFYAFPRSLPKLGQPELLERVPKGDVVVLRIRYRFAGDLSSAVRRAVDPAKLTWVEVSEHNLSLQSVTFHLEPDYYADRFACHGAYRFEADPRDPTVTVRQAEGEVKVRVPLVGGSVERAIVSGLHEHLSDEAPVVEQWLAANS